MGSLRSLALKALGRPAVESCSSARVHMVGRDASLGEALSIMSELRVGSLLVGSGAAEPSSLDGIITERDVLERLECETPLASATVETLMTSASKLVLGGRDWSLEQALTTMRRGHFRHLPIVDDGRVRMLSMRDAANELARSAAAACSSGDAMASPDVAAAAAVSAHDVLHARSRSVQIAATGGSLSSSVTPGPPSCIEVPHAATVGEAVLEMRRGRAGMLLIPVQGDTIHESRHSFGAQRPDAEKQRAAAAPPAPHPVEHAPCSQASSRSATTSARSAPRPAQPTVGRIPLPIFGNSQCQA